MKDLYLTLSARIADTLGAEWLVDLWNNQPDHPEKESVLTPAVYIDLKTERKNIQVGGAGQLVTARVVLYIIQSLYSDTHVGSPDQSQALVCLDTVKRLYDAMQNFGGSELLYLRSPMQCTADGSEQSGGGIWIWRQEYVCQFLEK